MKRSRCWFCLRPLEGAPRIVITVNGPAHAICDALDTRMMVRGNPAAIPPRGILSAKPGEVEVVPLP